MNILIAYHAFLTPETNAGCLRLLEIIRILRVKGYSITFLAYEHKGNRAQLEELGVKCVCDQELNLSLSPSRFEKFLQEGQFQAAVLVQYFVYNYYAPYLKLFLPDCHRILDTVDIHFLRLHRQSVLQPQMKMLAKTVERDEKRALRDADSIWVVTDTEYTTLQPLSGGPKTGFFVIPTLHPVMEDKPGYDDRNGMVFIGSYTHAPNLDAVEFLVGAIMPHLRLILPDVPITIAGSNMPPLFHEYSLQDPHLHTVGFVEDHRALLASCRVGLAPLRFGAGMKGKIGEFLACGLPCVTTPVGAEGMGLTDGKDVLVADGPQQFAEYAARLHTDAAFWKTLSEAGECYIQERVTPHAIAPTVAEAVSFAGLSQRTLFQKVKARLYQPLQRWKLRHPAKRILLPTTAPNGIDRIKGYLLRQAWICALRARLSHS